MTARLLADDAERRALAAEQRAAAAEQQQDVNANDACVQAQPAPKTLRPPAHEYAGIDQICRRPECRAEARRRDNNAKQRRSKARKQAQGQDAAMSGTGTP